jgi:hypothetical protein
MHDWALIVSGYATDQLLQEYGLTRELVDQMRRDFGFAREVQARASGHGGRRPRMTGKRR